MNSGSLKNVTYKLSICKLCIFMYKQDLALNNLQGLICQKTQQTNLTWHVLFKNSLTMTPVDLIGGY